jgi:UPF0755 protein
VTTKLDPLLPEAEIDPDDRPALDWPTDPWDNADRTGTVERLRRQTRPIKWLVYGSMVVAVVAILIAGGVGWWYLGKINPDGEPGDRVSFTVNDTDDVESLALRLEEAGLVSDASVFEWYVDRNGGIELTPGYYEIRPNDHMGNVLGRLRTPPGQTYSRVTFPEGFTIDRMAQRLESSVDRLTAAEFVEAASDPSIRSIWSPPGSASLEGLLFPDTYQVSNAESEAQVIERMIALMERVGAQEDIVAKSAALGRTPYETLIIASMIEREARVEEDRAKISRVIHNRLAVTAANPDNPFRLQIDAAVLYGRNQLGLDTDLPFRELRQIPSPWNTYLIDALPATPIASPGRASIRAALNPAPNPAPGDPICQVLPPEDRDECFYFYYVLADEDGSHVFAATGEQHNANVAQAAADGLLD